MRDHRKEVITRAKEEWLKLKTIPTNKEDGKWTELRRRVLCAVVQESKKLGIDVDNSKIADEIDNRLDGVDVILTFGKYKLHTVEQVSESDWPYLLWLAGYDFGQLDDKCRPVVRKSNAPGSKYITQDVERAAKDIIEGRCIKCACDMPHAEPWKRVCGQCYSKHKHGL